MRRAAAVVMALSLAGCKPEGETRVVALIGAVLIDGNGGPPVTDSVVVVANGRIRAAGSRAVVPIPAGADKIDGKGRFVVPGLIDLHVHLGSRAGPQFDASEYTAERVTENLRTYLKYGITTVRSVGTERAAGFEVRKAQPAAGARLFTAGRGFTAKGGHPSPEVDEVTRQVDDPAEARRQVGELASQQADLIKIWVDDGRGSRPKIKAPVIEAILDEARKHNLPVTAHIRTLADTKHLVEHGAAGFLHMIRDTEEIDTAFVNRLRALAIPFVPTLVRQELAWLYREKPELLDDPEIPRDVAAAVREAAQKRPAATAEARAELAVA
ncbi:MAG: amidohydrolase family protein, partial [Bryobacteraceae bacterium]